MLPFHFSLETELSLKLYIKLFPALTARAGHSAFVHSIHQPSYSVNSSTSSESKLNVKTQFLLFKNSILMDWAGPRFWIGKPGTSPRWEDRWGWFKWSVHVHVIDSEDSTTSRRGDDEGLDSGPGEGPVHRHCKNKWAPTHLSGLSHYWASPMYWFLPTAF